MTALDKAQTFLEGLQDETDENLERLFPGLPLPLVRGCLPYADRILPDTAAAFDQQLDTAERFLAWLREPDELPAGDETRNGAS